MEFGTLIVSSDRFLSWNIVREFAGLGQRLRQARHDKHSLNGLCGHGYGKRFALAGRNFLKKRFKFPCGRPIIEA